MHGKIVVITGCTNGIGKETAREFARLGAHVIMACRNLPQAETLARQFIQETQNPNIQAMECDLASFQSIRSFAKRLSASLECTVNRIDCLVLNAGVFSPKKSFTTEGYELHYGVNYLGHFLLTMLLLPQLQESDHPKVIGLSSFLHLVGRIDFANFKAESGFGPTSAYAQSKLAMVLFSKALARFVDHPNFRAYSFNPGAVSTHIMGYSGWAKKISDAVLRSPRNVAQEIVGLTAFQKSVPNGSYFSQETIGKTSPLADDNTLADRLWRVSLHQCDLDEANLALSLAAKKKENNDKRNTVSPRSLGA
jgi:NAD(P)-dependent dehydrogenase (short-subunit alcohol dehydrogenase family)